MHYRSIEQGKGQCRNVMTVIGVGRYTAIPDQVQITLEVNTDNKLLIQAQQENTVTMERMINSLIELGIDREMIQTISFNVFPQYDFVDGEQRFRAYEVTNTIQVLSPKIEQIGNLIDTAVQNGATGVSNIQFKISNEQVVYQKALSSALKNALTKAQTIAETMQLQLNPTPIQIVEENRLESSEPRMFAAKEMSGSTPIEQGQLTIRATATVQFHY